MTEVQAVPSEPAWFLGTIDGNSFVFHEKLSEAEYGRYLSAVTAISALKGYFAFRQVEQNYRDSQNVRQYISLVLSVGRAIGTPDRLRMGESVMTLTINWLTAFRLYLDHTEAQLKRRYGNTSVEWRRFHEATSAAFDGSVGYRFVYKLRNYVQHCGLPLSRITLDDAGLTAAPAVQRVRFLLDRDQLLANYGEWRQVRADLRAMPETFAADPLCDEAMEQLRLIERERLRVEIERAAASASAVQAALDRLAAFPPGGAPALIATRSLVDGRVTMTPTMIPDAAIDQLSKIAAGDADPDSIIGKPHPVSFPLDPANVRERLHTDTRGVQAISLFLEQGGATREFMEGVNQIVQEDNGPNHLITGLLNVSVVLVHAAAGAIGASAAGFLGGMLNIYGNVPSEASPDE